MSSLAGRVRVLGCEPGQLRVDLTHHGPDGGDPRLQGPPDPRSYGRRRAGRWPRPRAGERIRLSNTPSKIIRSPVSSGPLAEARLSTGCRLVPVESCCGSPTGKFTSSFSSTQPVDRVFACSQGHTCGEGHRFHNSVPRLRTTYSACLHTLVHTAVHGVTWCSAWRVGRMSELWARTVSGEGRSAFALGSLARGRSVR